MWSPRSCRTCTRAAAIRGPRASARGPQRLGDDIRRGRTEDRRCPGAGDRYDGEPERCPVGVSLFEQGQHLVRRATQHNGTSLYFNARKQRKPCGFSTSKQLPEHVAMSWLTVTHYNFCWSNRSLRVEVASQIHSSRSGNGGRAVRARVDHCRADVLAVACRVAVGPVQ